MFVIERASGKKHKTIFVNAGKNELKAINKDKRFIFNWTIESAFDVYFLCLEQNEEILGIASNKEYASELRLHLNLLELAKENQGRSKKYEGVAGCLIAKGCLNSFLKGYSGFLSLIPKTQLIQHYQKVYGFRAYGRQLAISNENSMTLIKSI